MNRNLFYTYLITVIFGICAGIVETLKRALIPRYALSSLGGTLYGLYYLSDGSPFSAANTVIGTSWEYTGPSADICSETSSSITIISMLPFLEHQKKGSTIHGDEGD